MTARTLHRLSARSVTTLKETGRHADGGGLYLSISKDGARRWVFLFRWRGSPREMGLGGARDVISNNTMLALLERMGFGHVTVHGFRSTFRDWASETTHFHGDVVEMALAHKIESDTEAAYRRGELFEKRKELMAAWSAYCESAAG